MITLMFTCKGCGLVDHKFQVPARESADHDVVAWMKKVEAWVSDEHTRVSPKCTANKLDNLKIPMEGADFIGQQVE